MTPSTGPSDTNNGEQVNCTKGQSGMLDCESVMQQLWDYLDQQLTPDRMQAIHKHLDDCQRCRPQAEFRQAFERTVASAREDAGDMDALRERIRLALRMADRSIE
ncbi:zf-HC2 domain-containing protein [Gemmatimonas sp.]|uniref:zf-HC2 domain-containing protein n=1 Tax=Gemmatimonas sp. TaxID=1962908 RepID=UPI00333E77BB